MRKILLVLLLLLPQVNAVTIEKATAGYSGYYKTNCWFPVEVEVYAQKNFKGEIAIGKFHKPVILKAGEREIYKIPVFYTDTVSDIKIELLQNGKAVDQFVVPVTPVNKFLVVSQQPISLGENYLVVVSSKLPEGITLDCADLVVAQNLTKELERYAISGGKVLILKGKFKKEKIGEGYIYYSEDNISRIVEDYIIGYRVEKREIYPFRKASVKKLPVILFLLVYTACVGPINYYLLKRFNRLELGWLTTLAIVVLFSVGAFGIGYSNWGSKPQIVEYGVMISTDSGSFVKSSVELTSVRRGEYEIYFRKAERLLPSSFEPALETAEVYYTNPPKIRDTLPMWSRHRYKAEFYLPVKFKAEAEIVNGSVKGWVLPSITLKNATFIWRGYSAYIGELRKGENTTFAANLTKYRVFHIPPVPYPEPLEEYAGVIIGVVEYSSAYLQEEYLHNSSYICIGDVEVKRIRGKYSLYIHKGRVVRGNIIRAMENGFVAQAGEVYVVVDLPENISRIVTMDISPNVRVDVYNWKKRKWEEIAQERLLPPDIAVRAGVELSPEEHIKDDILKLRFTVVRVEIPGQPVLPRREQGVYVSIPKFYIEVEG